MLLTIDIGNSQIVWGIFDKNTLVSSWRIATDSTKTADEYGILFLSLMNTQQIQPKDLIGTIISSVVPPVTHILICGFS